MGRASYPPIEGGGGGTLSASLSSTKKRSGGLEELSLTRSTTEITYDLTALRHILQFNDKIKFNKQIWGV